MSGRRPSARRLGAALAVLGVVGAAALLLLPVDAAFAGDPLLRLRSLGSTDAQPATTVHCGWAAGSLGRGSESLSFYDVARGRACRQAASRRAAVGVAAGAVVALLGLLGMTVSATRA